MYTVKCTVYTIFTIISKMSVTDAVFAEKTIPQMRFLQVLTLRTRAHVSTYSNWMLPSLKLFVIESRNNIMTGRIQYLDILAFKCMHCIKDLSSGTQRILICCTVRWPACKTNIENRSLGALRAPSSRLRPFGLALGPSGLLDNVLHALRALRLCDPRNSRWRLV